MSFEPDDEVSDVDGGDLALFDHPSFAGDTMLYLGCEPGTQLCEDAVAAAEPEDAHTVSRQT